MWVFVVTVATCNKQSECSAGFWVCVRARARVCVCVSVSLFLYCFTTIVLITTSPFPAERIPVPEDRASGPADGGQHHWCLPPSARSEPATHLLQRPSRAARYRHAAGAAAGAGSGDLAAPQRKCRTPHGHVHVGHMACSLSGCFVLQSLSGDGGVPFVWEGSRWWVSVVVVVVVFVEWRGGWGGGGNSLWTSF